MVFAPTLQMSTLRSRELKSLAKVTHLGGGESSAERYQHSRGQRPRGPKAQVVSGKAFMLQRSWRARGRELAHGVVKGQFEVSQDWVSLCQWCGLSDAT